MLGLLDVFVDRSRATIMLIIILVLMGYAAYRSIPIESTPDVKVPVIYVFIRHDGISPEDAERLIVRPIEAGIKGLQGLKRMTGHANEGSASIVLEFRAGFDSNKALTDVRNKVDDVRNKLPAESEKPVIQEINLSLFPVLNIILTGNIPERTLIQLARDLQQKIETVNGVLEVHIAGDRKDSLEIIVEPHKLEAHGLSLQMVRGVIAGNNRLVAAGSIKGKSGEFSIKVPSLIDDVEKLLNFPIKMVDGQILKVRDVATVKKTFKDPESIARVNGKPAVVLEVSKRTGENIILTVAQVKKIVEAEQVYWPGKLEVKYSQDESSNIIEMVTDLENNIIFAVMLVVIVVILSVGARSALLISLSIPTSFLAGILYLSLAGMTLNVVVLFSLILTIGLIVDDAIVVSEYADRLVMNGEPVERAFLDAAKRMFWPIVTSTVVKIVVFLPLLFWPGVVGQFMRYLPITAIVILLNSLLFALLFQPTLGPKFGKPNNVDMKKLKSLHASEEGDLDQLHGPAAKYLSLLKKVLQAPRAFVSIIFTLLISVYVFFFVFGTGIEFFPKIEPESAIVFIRTPGNLSLEEKDRLMKEVEGKILDLSKDIKIFYTSIGKSEEQNDGNMPKDTIASVTLEFEKWRERRKAAKILDDVRKRLGSIHGVSVEIVENQGGPPAGKPIQIDLTSRFSELLPQAADQIKQAMASIKGLRDIDDSRASNAIEWQIVTDREKAAQYGVDIGAIGDSIQLVTSGMKVSSYRPEDATDEVDIMLRFPEEYRSIKMLNSLNIVTTSGKVIPISNFTTIKPAQKISEIRRVDHERVVTIEADVEKGELVDDKVKRLKRIINDMGLDKGVKVTFKGEDEDQKEAAEFLSRAFILTLLLMFIIMLTQFNNIYHTIIIMSAVFLSTVGVLLGLIVTMQPFGVVMCGVGVIALGGIVLNNNILFIDTYQHLRKAGMGLDEAIMRAGIQRLRPILLTAVTAILGLLPMVFGLTINFIDRDISYDAPSSQWWRQLSASIAGGLMFATVLTLFFTPCLLKIGKKFDRYKQIGD